jgi:hypothetical protein
MTNSLGRMVRTCLYATLLGGAMLPMGSAFAQDGREPVLQSAEPIRLFVKELNKNGQLRKMSDSQIVEAARAQGLVGTETDHVRAGETYLRDMLAKLRAIGKLGDGERNVPAGGDAAGDGGALGFGGSGIAEVEPNDSIATAQAINCGDTVCGQITIAGDIDYYAVTPAVQSRIVFSTVGDPGGDTVIRVYTAGGQQLGVNDDTPGGSNFFSTCTVPCLAAGTTYYVSVIDFAGGAGLNYGLTASCTATTDTPETEANNTAATGTNMGAAPFSACGLCALAGGGDLDYLRFTVAADAVCTITNGPSSADLTLMLGNGASNTRMNFAQTANRGGESFTVGLRAGTYFLRNRNNKFAGEEPISWQCSVATAAPTANDELEPDNTTATAFPVVCNQTINAFSMADLTSGDTDYYTFTIPAGPNQSVSVTTGPAAADTFLVLYDSTFAVLGFNDDVDTANSLFNSEVDATLAPGTYFARVTNFLGGGVPAFAYNFTVACPAGNYEAEPNDTSASASPGLACATSIGARVGPTGDIDYYSLTLATEQAVTATFAGAGHSATVSFLQSDGTTVITSGTNSAVGTLDAGSYFIRVSNANAAGFDYTLTASCTATPVPVDSEPNDNVGNANATAGCGDSKVGLLSPRDSDVDYWSFNIAQWSLVTVSVTVPDQRSSVDPFLLIVDPMGNPLRVNDNFQNTINSQIVMNLPPGTWYAAVRSNTTGANPDPRPDKDLYEIHIVSCTASVCSTSQPLKIDNGFTVAGAITSSLSSSRPMGCLTFTTCATAKVDVTVSSTSIEPSVILTDGSNNYIDYDDDDGDGEAANITDTIPAGTYFLRVQNFGIAIGNFSVTLHFTTQDGPAESEPNDSAALANPLADQTVVTGRLSSGSDVDYYSFSVTGGVHGVTLISRSSRDHDNSPQQATDITLSLYTATPTLLLSQNTDNGPDADETIIDELPAGNYLVAVSTSAPVDPKAGAYDLELRVADVSVSLTPTHTVTLPCSSVMSFTGSGTNLRSAFVTATYQLEVSVNCGAPTVILTKTKGLNPHQSASKAFTRTLAQWLHNACPAPGSHVQIILTATQGVSQIASTTYDFTVQ